MHSTSAGTLVTPPTSSGSSNGPSRLEYVKIHFQPSWDEWINCVSSPVVLQLPADLPLRVLDLANATLPWSSYHPTSLRELHLDFTECHFPVEISEELLWIFDASPQSESLSLLQIRSKYPLIINNQPRYAPIRVAQFATLDSPDLDSPRRLLGTFWPTWTSLQSHPSRFVPRLTSRKLGLLSRTPSPIIAF